MAKLAAPCKTPQPVTHVSFNDQHEIRCLHCDFQLVPSLRPDGTSGWKHLGKTPARATK
jgi:hypothetical protein